MLDTDSLALAAIESTRRTLAAELAVIAKEVERRRYAHDPVTWATERLHDTLWSGQQRILRAVAQHRKVAVQTAHELGKSYSAAEIAAWWLDTHNPGDAFVITTAPTAPQVEVILWKEIGRAHQRGHLPGYVNQTDWKMRVNREGTGEGRIETVALGRKPSDYAPTAFQGIHAAFVLIIVDEANGVRGPLWTALDSLMANDLSQILEIGNPDDPSGEFYEHCRPGSGYHVISLSAFDSPNLTGEPMPSVITRELIGRTYIEEKRKKWAPGWMWVDSRGAVADQHTGVAVVPPKKPDGTVDESAALTNPFWHSKILGIFPENADAGGLIPLSWIKAAQRRTLEPTGLVELGVDVGGGGDATSVCLRRGPVFRIKRTDHDPDTMGQCGKIKNDLDTTHATVAKIDKIGIGWGIVDRGKEQGFPYVGINVSEKPTEPEPGADDASDDDRFLNKRAELWWGVRTLFESGNIDIEDETTPYGDDLAAELCQVQYARTSTGKIKILDKRKDAKGVTIKSPNLAESLMLAAAPVPVEKREDWATW